jgi:hypothetical protein
MEILRANQGPSREKFEMELLYILVYSSKFREHTMSQTPKSPNIHQTSSSPPPPDPQNPLWSTILMIQSALH